MVRFSLLIYRLQSADFVRSRVFLNSGAVWLSLCVFSFGLVAIFLEWKPYLLFHDVLRRLGFSYWICKREIHFSLKI